MNFYNPNFLNSLDQLNFYLSNPNLPAPLPDDPEQREAIMKMRKAIDDFHAAQKKIRPEFSSYATKNFFAEVAHQILKDRQESGL